MAHSEIASGHAGAPNLWTHEGKQYGVFTDFDDNTIACQFDAATKTLDATVDLSVVTGNPLSLPLDNSDPHETPSCCVTPDGVLYVTANNWGTQTIRSVRCDTTTDGADAANWSNAATEFDSGAATIYWHEYIRFSPFSDSVVMIHSVRLDPAPGSSGRWERLYRHVGSGWQLVGNIIEGDPSSEDAFYRNHMFVEGPRGVHPDRGHLFGAWDHASHGGGAQVDGFSYLYNDDEGDSWHAIDGTLLATPFAQDDPSGQAIDTGVSFGGLTDQLYAAGAAVDASGYPCGVFTDRTVQTQRIVRWNGSGWVVDTSFGNRYGGGQHLNLVWWRGDLWTLCRPRFPGVGPVRTDLIELRRQDPPNDAAYIGGPVGAGWFTHYDPVALRDRDVVEVLHVNNDVPTVVTFGNHARVRSA